MKNNILILLFIITTTFTFGQSGSKVKGGGYLYTPDILNSYCKASFIEDIYIGKNQNYLKSTNQQEWVVYSDRDNNKLFFEPDGRSKTDVLNFMEPLSVKEVRGEWLLLYSPVYKTGYTIEKHKERGWVKISNLIISSYSLLNEKGTPKKGMALISLDDAKQAFIKDGFERYKFYSGPDLRVEKNESKKFEIYYLFKDNKGVKLLSRTDKLNDGTETDLRNRVGGWMSNFNITSWDHRVCLEVASNENAVREYAGMNIPIYPSEDKLNNFITSGVNNTDGSIMKFNVMKQRPNPYIMRMPILNNKNEQQKQVATVGTLRNNTTILTEIGELRQKLLIAKNKLENINILFVIDGTQSMSPYYITIAKSITEIIENNKLSRANNKLRFGVVIYRDYADGEQVCEVEPLTSNHKTIIDKILITRCISGDKDLPEAQYNGMTDGIRRAGFNKDQSNIIVLIGDAGNHQPDPKGKTREQVINAMKQYDVSLITFQVFYGGDQTFTDFNSDAKYYLREIGKQVSEGNNVEVRLNPVSGIKNTYKLIYNDKSTNKPIDLYMFGRFTYASNKEPMSTTILEQNINGSVFEYLQWVTKIINETENVINQGGIGGATSTEYDETVKKYICEKFELTEAQCKLLFEKVEEFSFIGYTNTQFYEKQADCFVPVVFLSATELDKIEKTLNILKGGDLSTTEKKKAFQVALLEQTMRMLGEKSSDNVLNKNLNEIWDIILAIPFDKNKRYGKLGITKLRDMDKLDNKTFNDFMINFDASINKFSANVFKDFSFEVADQTFYWIPLSRIPGNE
jgi:hypothetical protein